MSQLLALTKPFPPKLVHKKPGSRDGKGDYVEHSIYNQALLATVGAFDWKLREIVRGYVPRSETTNKKTGEVTVHEALDNAVVAVICALTVRIDGREVTVEEVGDCERPHNWSNDGARLKDAFSDAIKRCAMRLGLGLHLYAQEDYFLHDSLQKKFNHTDNQKEPPAAKAPSNGEEGGGPNHDVGKADGPAPPSDPKTKTKLLRFRARCIEKGTDADEEAAKLGIVSAERLTEEQLDRLLAEV